MPPTWNNGIMLKQTSLELRPQEAMTHTAPTASVSRVYDTVFFLPLHAFTRQIRALDGCLGWHQGYMTWVESPPERCSQTAGTQGSH